MDNPIVLQLKGITKRFGTKVVANDHVDLDLRKGEILSILGENGSGKTLFVKHVISLLEKAGRQNEMLYLPQEISSEQEKTILSDFYKLEESERGEVLSTLYRLGSEVERLAFLRSENSEKEMTDEGRLSPGELRKLMIALAVQRPLSLLILDEPTNHMDITSVTALENALSSLDCAMIVVSHDKVFLEKISNASLVAERNGNSGEIKMN